MVDREQRIGELDDVRRTLVKRAGLKEVSLSDISRSVGKNVSYIHQFVWKGAPKTLPVSIRVEVARILDLPEDALRFPGEPTLAELTQAAKPAALARSAVVPPHEVPVFRDDDLIDPAKAEEWTSPLQSAASGGAYIALWITAHRGRLQAGDLAYVRLSQPPRVGDTALALSDRRVAGLGTLVSADERLVVIRDTGGVDRELATSDLQLSKVVELRLP